MLRTLVLVAKLSLPRLLPSRIAAKSCGRSEAPSDRARRWTARTVPARLAKLAVAN
jgi:hypothetical protein